MDTSHGFVRADLTSLHELILLESEKPLLE